MGASSGEDSQLAAFLVRLQRREVVGSFMCAKETAELMRKVVGSKWSDVSDLIERVLAVGNRLQSAAPHELSIGNVARHVVHIIRKVYATFMESEQSDADRDTLSSRSGVMTMSMQDMLLHQEQLSDSIPAPKMTKEFRQEVIALINEYIEQDLHGNTGNIAEQASEHIHANEVIMTFGQSNTVSAFLEAAANKIYFDVIIVESSPTYRGHAVARRLSKAGIMTTVIPDSAIFAMMGRCNKVIISTHAVLANGGILAPAGSALLAAAAKHHSVPMMVVTGLYKLSPLYPHDLHSLTDFRSPSQLMTFEEAGGLTHTSFYNPGFDYIPPEKVSLFITHQGGATPSYVYRLLAEYYD